MGFGANEVKAEVMGSFKPKLNGPQWKSLVQKKNEARSKVLTYESSVGGKRKHRVRKLSSKETGAEEKGQI